MKCFSSSNKYLWNSVCLEGLSQIKNKIRTPTVSVSFNSMLEVLTMAEEKRSIKNSKAKGESKGLGNFWE